VTDNPDPAALVDLIASLKEVLSGVSNPEGVLRTLLDQAVGLLKQDYAALGKGTLFEQLKAFLTGDSGAPTYEESAARLEMSPGAVKVAVHRLRQRYRARLRQEIEQTVTSPEQVEDEIRDLFAAFEA
jgi:RNA polymerase sigma-70 factor (ECF subfamily)